MGGLRAGGVTRFYQPTEDLQRLQHRCRWQDAKQARTYVQEVSEAQLLSRMPLATRQHIQHVAACLPEVFQGALRLLRNDVPTHLWYSSLAPLTGQSSIGSSSRREIL